MNRVLIATLTLLCGALLLAPRTVSLGAQTGVQQVPTGSGLPVTVIPASAVNGAGTATVPILFADGSASAPSLAFNSQSNTGLFRIGANSIGISINGTMKQAFDGGNRMTSDAALSWSNATSTAVSGIDTSVTRAAAGELTYTTVVFSALGTPANGTIALCTDCAPTTPASCPGTKASCVCAGSGVGSLAVRQNNLWYCPF